MSRILLKKIIAAYTQRDENKIWIRHTAYGRPFLTHNNDFRYSVAHTKNLVVIGIANKFEIGVDVEHLDRTINYHKVYDLLFTASELELFRNTDNHSRQENFINCWTRKEAFFKAKGLGLTYPFTQLEISFLQGKKAGIIDTKWREDEKHEWFLESLDFPGNYRGAVAIHGPVRTFDLIQMKDIQYEFAELSI